MNVVTGHHTMNFNGLCVNPILIKAKQVSDFKEKSSKVSKILILFNLKQNQNN